MSVPESRLITIEGVEGAGKSTQVALLADWLRTRGQAVVATAEPDGTPLGVEVRRVLGAVSPLEPLTEALLFAAARVEHVRHVIRPALARGAVVLCDRYTDSTVAYQGAGRGVPLDLIATWNRAATGGLVPLLTLVLDLDVGEGLRRARARGAGADPDPFERRELEFHERVRKAYWALQAREPDRVQLIDAGRPPAAVAAEVRARVAARLGLEAGA